MKLKVRILTSVLVLSLLGNGYFISKDIVHRKGKTTSVSINGDNEPKIKSDGSSNDNPNKENVIFVALDEDSKTVDTEPTATIGIVHITHEYRVNVRTGGSQDYEQIAEVNPGDEFPCIGVADSGWYNIILPDGRIGYLSNNLAQLLIEPNTVIKK